MAKKKYYAVVQGRGETPNIYTSWDDCKKAVIGFKGAIYKSFTSQEDAESYIAMKLGMKLEEQEVLEGTENVLEVYVDGSFKVDKNNFSYGLVALYGGEVIHRENGIGQDQEAAALRNVSGEMLGAVKAVEYAQSHDYKKLKLYYDYQGIESWATGEWKRNNPYTQQYHAFMQQKTEEIKIHFVKVKGHSGDKYNDMADELAKEALSNL